MKITIVFDTQNTEFDTEEDIKDILRSVSDQASCLVMDDRVIVHDIEGNVIGEARLETNI
jgi:sulfur carrier protein ThiS